MKNYKKRVFDLKLIAVISIILSLRMLGLFMVLPVLNTYGFILKNSTKFLISICIGVYSLFQIMFQIPFGYLSDKYDRKKVIIFGLFLFLIGSFVAANTESIWGILVGRIIQGSGAISSSLMALMFDRIQKKNYILAMTCVGFTFGCTFFIAIIISPIIVGNFGLNCLFWIIFLLTLISILIVSIFIKSCSKHICYRYKIVSIKNLILFLKDIYLLELFFIVLLINYILMSNFLIYPEYLLLLNYSKEKHWIIYCVILCLILIVIIPILHYIRISNNIYSFFIIFINIVLLSQIILLNLKMKHFCLIGILLFMLCFGLFSILIPTTISKRYSIVYRGSLMGIYSTVQFLGMTMGSFIGGFLYSYLGFQSILIVNINIIILYIFFIIKNNLWYRYH